MPVSWYKSVLIITYNMYVGKPTLSWALDILERRLVSLYYCQEVMPHGTPDPWLLTDGYTVLAWWQEDCQRGVEYSLLLSGISLLWWVGLNKGRFCPIYNGWWARETGGNFHQSLRSPNERQFAGLCKENAKESRLLIVITYTGSDQDAIYTQGR